MSRANFLRGARALAITSFLLSAFAQALTCVAGFAPSTPITDFTLDTGVGTALHSKTGLMWDACSYGQTGATCTGTATTYDWQQAFAAVAAANAGNYKGYADWRLPNVKELMSVAEKCRISPAINTDVFPATVTSTGYWSSTSHSSNAAYARYVLFTYGENSVNTIQSPRTQLKPIRLVRGGQPLSSYVVPKLCDLDINGDSSITADKDGVLLARYLLGFRGAGLVDNVTLGALRADASAVAALIGTGSQYDVFGRTVPSAATFSDGLVLLRMMLSVPDAALLNGITVPAAAQFTTGVTVRANVNATCGSAL
jgi:Protein of unknown function (DUF1566)